MQLQIEITTRCNFDCFYCAGRLMPQDDMPWETFVSLIERHIARNGRPDTVILQGEGEPTLHPDFFRMAQWLSEQGIAIYSITNGSYRQPERFIGLFSRLGVSLDTLDEAQAHKIGRHRLPRVLDFIHAAGPHLELSIHSVANGEQTNRIAAWCQQQGYRHIVQPLQGKPDYARRYLPQPLPVANGGFCCPFLSSPRLRYYTVAGIEMPCCFIKDVSVYSGLQSLQELNGGRVWPACCVGCWYGKDRKEPVAEHQ